MVDNCDYIKTIEAWTDFQFCTYGRNCPLGYQVRGRNAVLCKVGGMIDKAEFTRLEKIAENSKERLEKI